MRTEPIEGSSAASVGVRKTLMSGAAIYGLRFALSGLSMLGLNLYVMSAYPLEEVGRVAVLLIVANVTLFLSDFGIGSACVQRQRLPDDEEASSLYAAVCALWLPILLSIAVIASMTESRLAAMIFAILCAAPMNALRQMSTIAAEKRLAYGTLAIIDIAEAMTLLLVTIWLSSWGAWGYVVAHTGKCFVGWACSLHLRHFTLTPSRPRLSAEGVRMLWFGISFNTGNLLTSIRQIVNPIAVGTMLGLAAVGLSDRAVFIAGAPLLLLGAVQQRILFPFFSAIQHQPGRRRYALERVLRFSSCLDKAAYLMLITLVGPLIERFIPAYTPMIPLIWLLIAANVVFGSIAFACFPVLNAIGQASVVARLHLITTVASAILIWPMIAMFGLPGYIMTNLTLWCGVGYLVLHLHRFIPDLRVWATVLPSLIAFSMSLMLCEFATWCSGQQRSWVSTFAIAGASLPIYATLLVILDRNGTFEMLRMLRPGEGAKGIPDAAAK